MQDFMKKRAPTDRASAQASMSDGMSAHQNNHFVTIAVTVRISLTELYRYQQNRVHSSYMCGQEKPRLSAVAYLGGGLAPGPPPFQPTIIFHDGIFGRFTKFLLQKHQNLGIN